MIPGANSTGPSVGSVPSLPVFSDSTAKQETIISGKIIFFTQYPLARLNVNRNVISIKAGGNISFNPILRLAR